MTHLPRWIGVPLAVVVLTGAAAVAPAAAHAAAPASGRIAGVVKVPTASGTAPAAGVLVVATARSQTGDQPAVQTVTAADGSYRLPPVLPWTYSVCFRIQDRLRDTGPTGLLDHCHGGTGFADQGKPVTVRSGARTTVDEVLPVGAAITGRVVDPTGRPVAGGAVSAENFDEYDASTGSDGRYLLKGLPSTSAEVCAHPVPRPAGDAPGSAPTCTSATLQSGVVTTLDLTLVPAGGIRGHVIDAAGQPVGGAAVTVLTTGTTAHVTTKADGTWAVGQLPPGTATVCITPPTGSSLLATCAPGAAAGTAVTVAARRFAAVTVTLAAGVAVHGTVTDRAGAPLSGVQVGVDGTSTTVVTGPYGTYSLPPTGLRSAVCATPQPTVSGNPNGYLPTCATLGSGATGSVQRDIRLPKSGAVAGRVTDATGQPVSGVGVDAFGEGEPPVVAPSVTTGSDGGFLVRNLPAGGPWEVDVDVAPGGNAVRDGRAPAGWLPVPALTGITVPVPGRTTVPAVQLAPASGIDVTLVDGAGQPVTRGGVHITLAPGSSADLTAGADGRALFVNQPAETVKVCAVAVTPGPLYPTGLRQVCRTVTTTLGVLTPLTLTQPTA